jgi:hypothetical protein
MLLLPGGLWLPLLPLPWDVWFRASLGVFLRDIGQVMRW